MTKTDNTPLPPEVEEGNVEYKLKLLNPSALRIEHLITQMKWRLEEGEDKAVYEIGVSDDGTVTGLLKHELEASIDTLQVMASRLDSELKIIKERTIEEEGRPTRYAMEVLITKVPTRQEFTDIRVACLGNVDAGKSTLLGVLCSGELDNGRGRARLNMFRHLHEIESGRTSSINQEILAFDKDGEALYKSDMTMDEIVSAASKMITLIDLAGQTKYIKTTIFGLTGYAPEAAMIVIGANTGIVGTTKEHLGLLIALKIPFVIVISKLDMCVPSMVNRIVQQLQKILKSNACGKKMTIVVSEEDHAIEAALNFPSGQMTPIFQVSSVNGKNLNLLRTFFFNVPSITSKVVEEENLSEKPLEFQVDELFTIPDVSPVLAGTVKHGLLHEGDQVLLGPSDTGEFTHGVVDSIHRNRRPCRMAVAGQTASVAISQLDTSSFNVRRGQVLLNPNTDAIVCRQFEVDLFILFHATTIKKKFQCTIHIDNVVQTAKIVWMSKESLRTGQRAKVRFEFIRHPERLHIGGRILMRDGRTRAVGEVCHVYPYVRTSGRSYSETSTSSETSESEPEKMDEDSPRTLKAKSAAEFLRAMSEESQQKKLRGESEKRTTTNEDKKEVATMKEDGCNKISPRDLLRVISMEQQFRNAEEKMQDDSAATSISSDSSITAELSTPGSTSSSMTPLELMTTSTSLELTSSSITSQSISPLTTSSDIATEQEVGQLIRRSTSELMTMSTSSDVSSFDRASDEESESMLQDDVSVGKTSQPITGLDSDDITADGVDSPRTTSAQISLSGMSVGGCALSESDV